MQTMSMEQKHLFRKLQFVMSEVRDECLKDENVEFWLTVMNDDFNLFGKCIDELVADLGEYLDNYNVKEIVDGQLVFNGTTIEDVFLDEKGMNEVNPLSYYGLTREELKNLL